MEARVRTRRRLRCLVAGSLLLVLASAVLVAPRVPSAGAAEGGDGGQPAEGLGGFSTEAEGAPFSMLLFEPVTPVPVDPGQPHLRADHAYVHTDLSTGPQGRALASTLWPGSLIGDGFPTLASMLAGPTGQEPPQYPLKTDVRSPGQQDETCKQAPGGAGMCSFAEGFEVRATAQAGESPAGEAVAFGIFDGESHGRVIDGRAVTTVTAVAQDVDLLEGTITIDSVETTITTASDGAVGEATGRTTVSGLTIAGQGYTIDEDGLRPVGGDPVAELPGLPGGARTAEDLGIEVTLLGHEEVVDGAHAEHVAGGLQVRVDLGVLRDQLDTGPVEELLRPLPAVPDPGLPSEVTDPLPFSVFQEPYLTLQPVFRLSPEVIFVLGSASSQTAGSEPLELDFDLPGPPGPPTASSPAPSVPSEAAPATQPAPTTGSSPAPGEAVEEPVVASDPQPVAQPQPSGLEYLGFDGIAPLLGLLGLAAALAGSWGLQRVSRVVFGAPGSCPDGRDDGLPDLKGA